MKDQLNFNSFSRSMRIATTTAFFFLAGIGGTAIWQARGQIARVDTIEDTTKELKVKLDDSSEFINTTNIRLIRLETELGYIKEKQQDWKDQYDKDMNEIKQLIKEINP